MKQMDCLEDLRLEYPLLDGNPMCSKYKDHRTHVTDVRKKFPKLLKTDGADLSTSILSDSYKDLHLKGTIRVQKRAKFCLLLSSEVLPTP
jgi:hypothetical protein